ncbi:hypothetical protein [Knoellia subterranea]|uniref:PknH-like extracellular domain-containing protein n=1 Tax=Knoellia subterranea KCTC 19937 TaxID=1385521 RepID=A0A0A0JTA6_9MICO|nr:hypothetical protein [Knoellia subterranea]KGN38881.1 hypothetical protein N803_08740 [Knoellia subterranea KCTC 19937]
MSPISEDELRARLRSVSPTPMSQEYAEHIVGAGRARRRRRRMLGTVAVAAATAVIAVGAFALSDRIGPDEALPARPSPILDGTPVVTPTGSPTGSPTASPSATASTSVSSTPTASSSSTAAPNPGASASTGPRPSASGSTPTTQRPVSLLHADSWRPSSSFAGACGTDIFPVAARGNAYSYDSRSTSAADGRADREAYLFFPSTADASAFMNELRSQSRACVTASDGTTRGIVEALSGPWSDGLALSSFANQPTVSHGSVVIAVRSGSAVALSGASGPIAGTERVDPTLIAAARPSVEYVYPQLSCGLTPAGCRT